ncbi:hypothetical protein HPB47_001044 [Ixodes persulcatus]|uniref:Uncharacterized protein n=1 Tax=Ixodes persulcatus TaxID=34615 RepID=A0AC60PRM4_IXOPE|nr:hypothetical protein HPB47_001044 [Ixodes persulcatus]
MVLRHLPRRTAKLSVVAASCRHLQWPQDASTAGTSGHQPKTESDGFTTVQKKRRVKSAGETSTTREGPSL